MCHLLSHPFFIKYMFVDKIQSFIKERDLIEPTLPVLVALSGGADSVALLRVLMTMGYDCQAAHCNFHLRGDESNRDERFVTLLCHELGVPLEVKHFDVEGCMRERHISMEMACRELRYSWFEELMSAHQCGCIAVAHHSDDNIETFFLNALRGTGLAGVAAMKPRNGNVVRPLLCVSRGEIVAWLHELGQSFVTDSTNLENDALRNRLRNVVLPALYGEFPGAQSSLLTTIENLSRCNDLYRESVGVMRNIVSDRDGDSLTIDLEILASFDNREMLLYEILKPLGFNAGQCALMLTCGVGRHFVSQSHKAMINRNTIEVIPIAENDDKVYVISLDEHVIEKPVRIEVDRINNTPFLPTMVDGKNKVAFDNELLDCSQVVLRHWREGDRFKPFGMHGTKLVSDLFTDLKLSEKEKHDAWLLDADGQIVWVLGYRASQHYAVKSQSLSYLLLSI